MIKKLIRLTLVTSFVIIAHNQIWANLDFHQQPITLLKIALILSFFKIFIKPILKILLLPINILTLGAVKLLINTLGLYLAEFIIANFEIQNIATSPTKIIGIPVSAFEFIGFPAHLVSSLSINTILGLFSFILFKKKKI